MSIAEILDTMDYGTAPESDTEARAWIAKRVAGVGHFINGGWVKPEADQWFDTSDPSTGAVIMKLAEGGAADVDAAVKAARKAQGPLGAAAGP